MTEPVTLDQLKAQLRLDGVTDEDDHLQGLLTAARRKVELATRRTFGGDLPTLAGDDAALAAQAILLIAAHWYRNREATGDARSSIELPLSATWILDDLRKWDAGE